MKLSFHVFSENRTYHLLWTMFFMLIYLVTNAQTRIDSLKDAISDEHVFDKKITLLYDLSLEYKSVDLQQSRTIARQALALINDADDSGINGLLLAHLGDIAFLQDSLKTAENFYKNALGALEQAGEFKRLMKVYISLGNRFVEVGNYPEAMNYYLKGLNISEETGDSTYLPNFYNNLGVVYLNTNDHRKALDYYSRALPMFEKLKDTMNVAGATTNIGSIYIQLEEYDIARQYYLKGYEIFKTIDLKLGMAHALFKLGTLDQMQNQPKKALENLLLSKSIQEDLQEDTPASKSLFLAETNINLGMVYYDLEEYSEAEKLLKKGLIVAMDASQNSLVVLAADYLSRLFRKQNDYVQALDYFMTFKSYADSIFNEENIRRLAQLEVQHQFDARLRESDMQRLSETQKRKRLQIIYFATTVGLLLVITIVFLLLKLEKDRKKKAEVERKLLEEKLEHTNKEMTTYVMYLMKKNEFILTIIEKLKKARLDAKAENKRVIGELISELQSDTESVSWEEFEVRFQQVHTKFYKKLSEQFPDLTPNEMRLCAFFKLNMTTKEIAALTYQSLNSIKVARYRLRKKLKLDKDEHLVSFLTKL